MKKQSYRLTAKEFGHNGSPNAELHHFYSNEEWNYFQTNLPIMKKNFRGKLVEIIALHFQLLLAEMFASVCD